MFSNGICTRNLPVRIQEYSTTVKANGFAQPTGEHKRSAPPKFTPKKDASRSIIESKKQASINRFIGQTHGWCVLFKTCTGTPTVSMSLCLREDREGGRRARELVLPCLRGCDMARTSALCLPPEACNCVGLDRSPVRIELSPGCSYIYNRPSRES